MNKISKRQASLLNLAYKEGWESWSQFWVCPLWYTCIQLLSYFSLHKIFSLVFLKLFCPLPVIPSSNSYPQLQPGKGADEKNLIDLIITIDLCLNNFERYMIRK